MNANIAHGFAAKRNLCRLLLAALLLAAAPASFGQTPTAINYQGRLTDAGQPAAGLYDFQFALYTAQSGGTQVGSTVTLDDVQVTDGLFTVTLSFGASPFTAATAKFLEIGVRPGASAAADPFTTLSPRQPVTSSPYSVQTVNAEQLGGVAASQYVRTTDSRLSDARSPAPGSGNYIQNGTTQQPGSANFNISGNGTVGGTLTGTTVSGTTVTGGTVNATSAYNFGGSRLLSPAGTRNIFAGLGTGTGGTDNSFFGSSAGFNNQSAATDNTFVGSGAGSGNTTGSNNTFVGSSAGVSNALNGQNTTGSSNTFIGYQAAPAATNLTNATAVGANASVRTSNSLVLGDTSVSVAIGTDTPKTKLHVAGGNIYIDNQDSALILKDPNSHCYALHVSANGTLFALSVTCP